MIERLAGRRAAGVVSSSGGDEPKSEAALKDGDTFMDEQTRSTPVRAGKGLVRQPPILKGDLKAVADAVSAWPDVIATSR